MNKRRREKLKEAAGFLSKAEAIVEAVCEEEEDSMDNMPENLQGTDKYELMEEAVDSLNDAVESIDEAKTKIETAIG